MKKSDQKSGKTKTTVMPRTSVSFPPELYQTLEELARKKKVSIAWVIRDAAEQYVAAEWPLFASNLTREVK